MVFAVRPVSLLVKVFSDVPVAFNVSVVLVSEVVGTLLVEL